MSDDLPTVEWLEDLAKEAAALAHSLETAMAFKEGEEG
jgi:hypothetical protein